MRLLCCATVLAVPPAAQADDFTFGVQTHFGQGWDPPELVPRLKEIGVESVRDAQRWEDIERAKDNFVFSGRYQTYMDALKANAIEPLLNFGRSNRYHDRGCTPYTDSGRRSLGRFAQEALQHYGRQIGQVGIYNEPNLPKFGDYDPGDQGDAEVCNANARADRHRALAVRVYDAVKAERRDATVSAPELSAGTRGLEQWQRWLDRYLAKGGARHLDAVSLHTYRPGHTPEGLAKQQIEPVRKLMKKHGIADKPIWITEMGWRSEQVGEQTQAEYLPRAYVLAMQAGVERMHWYNLVDHGKGTFGLLRRPAEPTGEYTPKPAYHAYGVMTGQLGALTYDAADKTPAGIHSHRFAGAIRPVRVMWAVNGERTVQVRSDEPLQVTDMLGKTETLTPVSGQVTLALSGAPKYVHGNARWGR